MSLPKYNNTHIWDMTSDREGRPDGELVPMTRAPLEWVKPSVELRDQLSIRYALLLIDIGWQWVDSKAAIRINGYRYAHCHKLSKREHNEAAMSSVNTPTSVVTDLCTCF